MAGPLQADETEQSMLDRIPLESTRGIVVDRSGESVGSGNGLIEAVSSETFHDLAQHAQIRFAAERHRAPIRSFLVTLAWFGAFPHAARRRCAWRAG